MSDYFTLSTELFESVGFNRLSTDAKILLVRAISMADASGMVDNLRLSMNNWGICSRVLKELMDSGYIKSTNIMQIIDFEYLTKGES